MPLAFTQEDFLVLDLEGTQIYVELSFSWLFSCNQMRLSVHYHPRTKYNGRLRLCFHRCVSIHSEGGYPMVPDPFFGGGGSNPWPMVLSLGVGGQSGL